MKVPHAVRGLCLLAFATFTTASPAKRAWEDEVCGPRCQILQQIKCLESQLEELYARLAKTPLPPVPDQQAIPRPINCPPNNNCPSPSPIVQDPTPAHTAPNQLSTFTTIPTPIPKPDPIPTPIANPNSPPPATMPDHPGYRSVAYFTNWGIYGRGYPPSKIPYQHLTHILYSFADNREDGTVFLTDSWADTDKHYDGDSWNDVGKNLYGNLKQLNLAKKQNRNVKIMLSIGGWTYTNVSRHFDAPAASEAGRKQFARSCVQLIKDMGFDGIDLDWEYPQNPQQGEHLLLLLHEIRAAMDAYAETFLQQDYSGHPSHAHHKGQKPHFELSIAAPAGKPNYQNYPLGKIGHALDFINVMGYDFAGAWDGVAGHQANLYPSQSKPGSTPFSIQAVIDDYIAAGVAPQKLVLGMPLYGRTFTNTDGLGQPFQGVGEGSWEQGIWDFKVLPKPGATEHFDEETGASYSYDPNSRTVVSYDTVEMQIRKAKYIKDKNLGGAMWWELNGDREDAEGSLIANVVRELGGHHIEKKENWLLYPDSCYENLRAGFPNDS